MVSREHQSHTRTHSYGSSGLGEDEYAGLFGPLIVSRKGSTTESARPSDVDREFVMVMGALDENESPYLRQNIYDKITKPSLGSVKPGYVAFGPTGKIRALQALYNHANQVGSKLSYDEAETLIENANSAKTYVDEVNGVSIHIWFDKDSFNPRWYDSRNGGTGSALQVLENLWREQVDLLDPKFHESNVMHSTNGYVYCT